MHRRTTLLSEVGATQRLDRSATRGFFRCARWRAYCIAACNSETAPGGFLRILLVDDTGKDVALLRQALSDAGHTVVGEAHDAMTLLAQVVSTDTDVVIVDTDSPSRDVLEQLCIVTRDNPRPIVMFTDDGDTASIRAALDAGVTTYIVEGLQPHRVRSILEVAKARFDADIALRAELEATRDQLAARKHIERAKGLLMKSRDLDEDAAYRALRKLAMDRQSSLVAVAQQVIDAANLLG